MAELAADIDGYKAVINFDPEIELFLGKFIGTNGTADFYAKDVAGLKKRGALSLKVFLKMSQSMDTLDQAIHNALIK